jgi:hypothetical protein
MEIERTAIALLASMVLVLAGMVGWLYWQQTRMVQNMGHIIAAIGELAQRPAVVSFPAPKEEAPTQEPEIQYATSEQEDDRASVEAEESPAIVSGPPPADTDDLESKSKKELQDILTKRGIPYSKSDNKTALISLLKATA